MLSKVLTATDVSDASDVKGLDASGSREALPAHVINVRDVGRLYVSSRRALLPKLETQQNVLIAARFAAQVAIPLGIPFSRPVPDGGGGIR